MYGTNPLVQVVLHTVEESQFCVPWYTRTAQPVYLPIVHGPWKIIK